MTILDDCFGLLFQKIISDACFRWLFQVTVPDDYFECLFQMPISDDFSRWLFRMTISDASEWQFRITVPDEYFGCLFQMTCFIIPRLIRILATNLCFRGRFLFQPIIRLIGPTTDSFLNDGFLLQNYGPDPPW